MRVLVAGGAGFIGSNFIRHLLGTSEASVVNFDALTYAGNLENLADVADDPRYRFIHGDIVDANGLEAAFSEPLDAVVNFAAESHVDRSILDSSAFVRTNIQGTQVLLEMVRKHRVPRYLQVSTDEVYGTLGPTGLFREDTPLAPNSPYAASKAAADLLVRAYHETYGLDAVITRCSNNYGPYQFPEKLIPLMILNALEDRRLPVYGDGLYTRDWIHVADHSRAVALVLEQGKSGEVYNIGASQEMKNIEVVRMILDTLGKPESLIEHVKDRPGHDRRYAIDSGKIQRELGWEPMTCFDSGLQQTIAWYVGNGPWVERVRSGTYRDYYQRMYVLRGETLDKL